MATSSYPSRVDKSQESVTNKERIKKFVRELDTLPSLPSVAAKLLDALQEETPDLREVQKLFELDPATSMKLLRYANSPHFSPRDPVVSIPRAFGVLGVSQLRGVPFGVAISETVIAEICRRSGNHRTHPWKHALACAVCARMLAERLLPDLASEAFAVGLVHDVGKLILKECMPEQYEQVETIHRDTGMPLMEAEATTLGVDHPTAGKWLAERWGLPPLIVQGIWLHHHSFEVIAKLDFSSAEHRKLILILSLANELAHDVMADFEIPYQTPAAKGDILTFLGLELDILELIKHSAGKRYREYTALLGPREDELPLYVSALQRANQKLARSTSNDVQMQAREKVIQGLSRLHEFHAELSSCGDCEDLLERVARELADGLGEREGVIYLLKKEIKKLAGRHWTSGKIPKAFSLDLNEEDTPLPCRDLGFMEDQVVRLIQTGRSRFRGAAGGSRQLIRFQYSKPYLIIPIIVEGELSGEILINKEGGEPREEANLSVYRYLADAAAHTLSRVQALEKVRENAEMLNVALAKIDRTVKGVEEKDWFAAALSSIADGVIAADIDGNIVFSNKGAEILTGWPEAEAIGKPLDTVFTLINTKVNSLFENPLERMLERGKSPEGPEDVAIVSKDGTGRLITLAAAPIHDRSGKTVGTVIVLRDLSARKRAEEEHLRAQKLKASRAFAGGIAQDFNSLLTLIVGNVSLAGASLESGQGNPIELLGETKTACLMAKDLTQRLTLFANGGGYLKRRRNIAELVKDAVNVGLSGSSVRYRLDLPLDLWQVECDSSQIHQMIGYIVLNAREAMPYGGTIEVKAGNVRLAADELPGLREGGYVKISIKDHGTGIARENVSKLFDPYFSTKEKGHGKGMGLGLAIADSIVRGHEGHIAVESEEGSGCTFHIYLPCSQQTVVVTGPDAMAQLSEVLDAVLPKTERRNHPRAKVEWPVTALANDNSIIEGETRDISAGGACIRLRNLLQPGEDFKMIIKPHDTRLVSVASKVIWSCINGNGESESATLRGMGVRFVGIRDEDRQLLYELASN